MTKDEAMKHALNAITQYLAESPDPSEEAVENLCDARAVLGKTLAQPEQEPSQFGSPKMQALILAKLAQRKPLTNEEITKAFNEAMAKRPKDASNAETNRLFVRAIEAAHNIKEQE